MPMTMTHFTGNFPRGFTPLLGARRHADPLVDLGITWLEPLPPDPPRSGTDEEAPSVTLMLARAVANIVAIAAERARQTGELAALREEVQRALDQPEPETNTDPREAGMDEPPPISDAETQSEGERLAALMRRQKAR